MLLKVNTVSKISFVGQIAILIYLKLREKLFSQKPKLQKVCLTITICEKK